jgi:hypothetical protein
MICFKEIQKRILSKFDYTISEMDDTEELATLDLVKFYINSALEKVYSLKMPFMRKEARISLTASYSTGTLTATAGSKTLTGSGSTWLRAMEGQKIVITDGTDGDVVYRLNSYSSGTSFTLDTDYIHTGGSTLSYVIYYDKYTLPKDFKTLIVMQDVDPLKTYYNDDNYLLSTATTSDVPSEVKFLGLSDTSYYDTGTLAITTLLKAVVGTNTAFDSTMVGRYIMIGTYGRLYEVTAVADATHLTIDKAYGGDTQTATKYKIDPPGLQEIRFHSAPSAAKIIPYTYWKKYTRLVEDNDVAEIPSDVILFWGAVWLWYQNIDSPLAAQAKANFDEEIARLSMVDVSTGQESMPPSFG